MKNNIKNLVIGFLIGTISSTTVFASKNAIQKYLEYNNIKITLNNKEIIPKDANGNYIEPFIIDGTTYLPVRGISSALGLYVDWDSNNNTVMISETPIVKSEISSQQFSDGKNHDIQLTAASLEYEYGVPVLYLDYKNNTNSDIIRFDIYVRCYDAYGKQIGKTFSGFNMNKLLANDIGSQHWDLYLYSGVQKAVFGVYKYQTADGKTVEIPENEIKWYNKSY